MEQDEDLLPPPKKLKVEETPVSNNEFKSAVEDTRIEVVESDCDGINRNDETLGSDAGKRVRSNLIHKILCCINKAQLRIIPGPTPLINSQDCRRGAHNSPNLIHKNALNLEI